jgi:hypothetical protein
MFPPEKKVGPRLATDSIITPTRRNKKNSPVVPMRYNGIVFFLLKARERGSVPGAAHDTRRPDLGGISFWPVRA